MLRSRLTLCAVAALALGLLSCNLFAADKKEGAKVVTGTSACATCSGVTTDGHNIMLVDAAGTRWVLIGDSESYKVAHKVRDEGKKMSATLASEPITKKDDKGKEYKEVKVSDVKIEA